MAVLACHAILTRRRPSAARSRHVACFSIAREMNAHDEQVILIVDDDPDLVALLTDLVTCDGFRVLSASHGLEALEIVEKQRVDLVFSDIDMPHCDGFELLKRIKARNPHHPVVVLQTGHVDVDLEQTFLLGAEGVHFKPFDFDILPSAIRSYCPPPGGRWRRFARHAVDLQAEILSDQKTPEWRGCTSLARGGMFVEGDSAAKKSTSCQFRLYASHGPTKIPVAHGSGIVTWKKLDGFAIEFMQPSPDFIAGIAKIIVRRPSFANQGCYIARPRNEPGAGTTRALKNDG